MKLFLTAGIALTLTSSIGFARETSLELLLESNSANTISAETCVEQSASMARQFQAYRVRPQEMSVFKNETLGSIERAWQLRLALHDKLRDLYHRGELTKDCANSIRGALVAIRALEDYLGFQMPQIPEDHTPFKPDHKPSLLVNPKFGQFALRSGDLILSRGLPYSSAVIARMPDNKAQFSHLAVVYIDPQTRKVETIEAHIEIGSVVGPFSGYLKDAKTRAAVFRFDDAELAHRAAEAIRAKVSAQSATGSNVPYDFSLDWLDHSRLFCSEVASAGFEYASNGKVSLPLFRNTITQVPDEFLNRLGVRERETFMPGDLEIDPRFEPIAEWRDYSRIRSSTYKDAILTSMYRWMKDYGYRFQIPAGTAVKSELIYTWRHTPLLGRLIKKRFPMNMLLSTVESDFLMKKIGPVLEDELSYLDETYREREGAPMMYEQLLRALDNIREDDHAAWSGRSERHTTFHQFFNPAK